MTQCDKIAQLEKQLQDNKAVAARLYLLGWFFMAAAAAILMARGDRIAAGVLAVVSCLLVMAPWFERRTILERLNAAGKRAKDQRQQS